MILHLTHFDDLYEISLDGHTIRRISKYIHGYRREEVEYDNLPEKVKERILDKVVDILREESEEQ